MDPHQERYVMVNGREKFLAFERVRSSGLTNMFDIKRVQELAEDVYGVELAREDILFMQQNYSELLEQYNPHVVSA